MTVKPAKLVAFPVMVGLPQGQKGVNSLIMAFPAVEVFVLPAFGM